MKKNFQNILKTANAVAILLMVSAAAYASPERLIKDTPGEQRRVPDGHLPGKGNDLPAVNNYNDQDDEYSYNYNADQFKDGKQYEGTNYQDSYDYRAVYIEKLLPACGNDVSCQSFLFGKMITNLSGPGNVVNDNMVSAYGSCLNRANAAGVAECMRSNMPQYIQSYTVPHRYFVDEASQICEQIDDDANEVGCYKLVEQNTYVRQSRLYQAPQLCSLDLSCHRQMLENVINGSY